MPFLKRWVSAARKYHLKIWFRSNWSGWESWFNYPKIDQQTHLQNTQNFILNNADLFENGDIFTACTECENGGPGDPRKTGQVIAFRNFITSEYRMTKSAFTSINKKVSSNLFPMNLDVVKLVMDQPTTQNLGGVMTIDNYVASPEKIVQDIKEIASSSGGKVVIGEFGAPIPDIQGNMSEHEQALWLKQVLDLLFQTPEVVGLNYWVNTGGSTQLWTEAGLAKEAVKVLHQYYSSR